MGRVSRSLLKTMSTGGEFSCRAMQGTTRAARDWLVEEREVSATPGRCCDLG